MEAGLWDFDYCVFYQESIMKLFPIVKIWLNLCLICWLVYLTPLFLLTYIFLIIRLYILTCSTIYFGHFFKMISIFCKKSFTYLGFLSSKLIPLLIPSLSFKTQHIRNLQYLVECDNFDHSKTVVLGEGAGLRRPPIFFNHFLFSITLKKHELCYLKLN